MNINCKYNFKLLIDNSQKELFTFLIPRDTLIRFSCFVVCDVTRSTHDPDIWWPYLKFCIFVNRYKTLTIGDTENALLYPHPLIFATVNDSILITI